MATEKKGAGGRSGHLSSFGTAHPALTMAGNFPPSILLQAPLVPNSQASSVITRPKKAFPPNPTPGSLSWSLSLSVLQHCRLPGWKPWIPPAPTLFCVCVPSMAQAPSLLNPTNLPCNFWEGREGSSQEMGTPHPPLYPEFL